MELLHNEKARSVWNAPGGRYDEISRTIADAIEHAVERLEAVPGERILDLATGTGWASRLVARRAPESVVMGVDIADQMLESARTRAARDGLAITYRQGDAERLPFEDGSFDAVVSTFGVMFASNPEAAAGELARVVRRGGRVVLATWKDDSNVANMFGVMRPFMAATPPSSPFAWGRVDRLQTLLGEAFHLAFEEGVNTFRYASGAQAWKLWLESYGPIKALAQSLEGERREGFERAMITWHETFAGPLGYVQPRAYLITRGIRR